MPGGADYMYEDAQLDGPPCEETLEKLHEWAERCGRKFTINDNLTERNARLALNGFRSRFSYLHTSKGK